MRFRTLGLIGALLATALMAGCGSAPPAASSRAMPSHRLTTRTPAARRVVVSTKTSHGRRPNIVFVLMDDASYDLLATMSNAHRLQAHGATYLNAHVVDSLCCPSRAAIFTGRPPHQTGVLTNTAADFAHPLGGFPAYLAHHNEQKAFNVSLQRSGYTTGFIGKYLNGYDVSDLGGYPLPPPPVPGWSYFDAVLGGGYHEWGFWKAQQKPNGQVTLVRDHKPPRDSSVAELDRHYATNVMSRDALSFVRRQRGRKKPYFLEVATYGPHAALGKAYPDDPSFPSAFADRAPAGDRTGGNCGARSCGALSLRDLKGYDDPRGDNAPTYLHADGTTSPAPPWNTAPITLTGREALDHYRDRARMVQSIDRMVGRLRKAVGPNTYLVLSSDNGFHLGQLQLNGGKGTPYDFDTRVPLVVSGPGVVPGPRKQFVSSIDFASTFESLAGLRSPAYRSGTSFAKTFAHPHATFGHFVFYDHTDAPSQPGEVDNDVSTGGHLESIPSYIGVRGKHGLLVRFDLDDSPTKTDYAWELYRYDVPWENRNVFAEDHDKPYARELMRRLMMWDDCAPAQCRAAAR